MPEARPAPFRRRRLAVLGSPIEHSMSPVLHATAYKLLGLPFEYDRIEVGAGGLGGFLDSLADGWQGGQDCGSQAGAWLGLSLTMPLKREVVTRLGAASPLVRQLGVANTVVFTDEGLAGYNTDVDGIVRAIGPGHIGQHEHAAVLGGGATAASALAALATMGVGRVDLFLRDPSKAGDLLSLAAALELPLEVSPLSAVGESGQLDFVVSTLPGGTVTDAVLPASPTSVLLDVAYDPWPSPRAAAWKEAGGSALSGLDMLVEQAIGQVRLFAGLPQDAELPDETAIRASMRESVGLVAVP